MFHEGVCLYKYYTDQGWEPKPYHASWRIWKPRPSRIVFLFPIDLIKIPNTTVCGGRKHNPENQHNITHFQTPTVLVSCILSSTCKGHGIIYKGFHLKKKQKKTYDRQKIKYVY